MNDKVPTSAHRLLHRISAALDAPVEALFVPPGADAREPGHSCASPAEINTLLAAFVLVKDGQARRRIIAAAEAEAKRAADGFDGAARGSGAS